MINIVLFGKPGAGKGTQADFLKHKYNLVHLSTGDIFRFNIKNDTELGRLAKLYLCFKKSACVPFPAPGLPNNTILIIALLC